MSVSLFALWRVVGGLRLQVVVVLMMGNVTGDRGALEREYRCC